MLLGACRQITVNRDTALYTKTGTTKTDGDYQFAHDAFTELHKEATEHLRNDRERKRHDRNKNSTQLPNGDNDVHGTRVLRFMRGDTVTETSTLKDKL